MRIDSSGNVLLGKASQDLATAGFQHRGDAIGLVQITRDSGEPLQLNRLTNDGKLIEFRKDTTLVGAISIQGSDLGIEVNGAERVRIDSSGRLLVGTSSSRNIGLSSSYPSLVQVETTNYAAASFVNNSNDVQPAYLTLGKSRGGIGGNTVVQSGDVLGHIGFAGADGTDLETLAAHIQCAVDGTPGANDMPGRLLFSTTADGSASPTPRMTIKNDGNVGIGTENPSQLLHLSSTGFPTIRVTDADNSTYFDIANSDGDIILKADEGNAFADSAIRFMVDSSEKFRCDSSGRLLVGTSSSIDVASTAPAIMQVTQGGTGLSGAFYSTANALGPGGVIALGHGRNSTSGLLSDDDVMGQIRFAGADGNDMETVGAQISAEVDGTPGANDMPGRLVFSTTADGASSPTEHIRIDNAGTTTVWSTSAPMLWGRNETSGSVTGLAYYNTATSTTSLTGQVFRVMCDGDVENANNSYGAISDANLKENIVDAESQWSDLKSLQVRKYNFKQETGYGTHTQIGLIAQEVELISPGLVGECIDGNTGETSKTISYSVLYMKAVKALQEAMERIETLETSNADLLARVSALEAS